MTRGQVLRTCTRLRIELLSRKQVGDQHATDRSHDEVTGMAKVGKKFLAAKAKVEPRPYGLPEAVKLIRDVDRKSVV